MTNHLQQLVCFELTKFHRRAQIGQSTVTMQSDRFICARERFGETTQIVKINLLDRTYSRKWSVADSAIISPEGEFMATKSELKIGPDLIRGTMSPNTFCGPFFSWKDSRTLPNQH